MADLNPQIRQLQEARYQRSQGIQTSFDDDFGNRVDDRVKTNRFFDMGAKNNQSSSALANRQDRSKEMASPKQKKTQEEERQQAENQVKFQDPFAIKSRQQTDMRGQDVNAAVARQNNQLQSSDRRYATDRTSQVNMQLGTQRNQVDLAVGLDRNAVTRDVGKYTSDNNLRASNYKTYADLQAALNRNQLNSKDSQFETTTKYSTQERINQFNRLNIDRTELATAQVKAGTYGMSKGALQKAAADKTNFDNWKNYNDAQFNYADRTNAQIRLGQQMAQSERAYNDSRNDRSNDRAAAMARFNSEQSAKAADRSEYYRQQNLDRDLKRQDFALRSQQIQSQIDLANREFGLKQQMSAAQIAEIYSSTKLKNDQFGATRADVSYNRGQQGRSNLAF